MALLDAAEAFSHLAQSRISVEAAYCVTVRNRNASCDACMAACPTEAISVHDNTIDFFDDRCLGCGACASVCPTQALVTTAPSTQEIAASINELHQNNPSNHTPLFVLCERAYTRIAQALDGADESVTHTPFLVVPCLAYLDESLYLQGFTQDHAWVVISDTCTTCPCEQSACIESFIEQAHRFGTAAQCDKVIEWLYADESESLIVRLHARDTHTAHNTPFTHPDHATLDLEAHTLVRWSFTENAPKVSRRGFFSSLVEQTNDAIAHAAAETLSAATDPTTKTNAPKPTLARVLTAPSGKLKQTTPERVDRILNCLFDCYEERLARRDQTNVHEGGDGVSDERITEMLTTPFSSRIFSHVRILKTCNGCGLCATFCPTGALRSSGIQETDDLNTGPRVALIHDMPKQTLTFRCNDCVSCKVCADSCPRNAITFDPHVTLDELFSLDHITVFDPRDPV